MVVVQAEMRVLLVMRLRVAVRVLCLLGELGALDDVLDRLLLLLALLVVAPPERALVLALQAEVLARATGRLALVALLPP